MAVGDLDDGPIPGPPPLATGIIGELFWNIAEAVVILDHGRALRWTRPPRSSSGSATA